MIKRMERSLGDQPELRYGAARSALARLGYANVEVITGDGSEAASCSIADPYVGRSSCAGSSAGEGGLGYPCFRPDAVFRISLPGWRGEIEALSRASGV